MRLGLITDIHEHVEYLIVAIDRLQSEGVDQIVVLGDIFETGDRLEETCRLLNECGAIGVWGNHDYGFCVNPMEYHRNRFSRAVLEFMGTLKPRLTIDDCHFTHVEPWLNPQLIEDLWYYDGPPDVHGKLDRIFRATPERLMFAGHFHKWLLATPDTITPWDGSEPVLLRGSRYFTVIGALCLGQFAIFETATSELIPFCESQAIDDASISNSVRR